MKYRVPPLWPTYIGGMEDNNFAKAYEVKVMCYGEHVGEHIENLMRTHWELGENDAPPLPPTPKLKWKKARHLECMLGPSHWLREISLPKRVCHHFWPGLIPISKNTIPIC